MSSSVQNCAATVPLICEMRRNVSCPPSIPPRSAATRVIRSTLATILQNWAKISSAYPRDDVLCHLERHIIFTAFLETHPPPFSCVVSSLVCCSRLWLLARLLFRLTYTHTHTSASEPLVLVFCRCGYSWGVQGVGAWCVQACGRSAR